ncbi:hypothetical protein Q1695_012302 [Nippostrongylus brasiliensis]|nr:hypothetical protein Q1695_012302 [Nippostrongylus brasiliensis]
MIYVVVGGGIAGVSCIKRLLDSLPASDKVFLISASKRVKRVTQWKKTGQYTEQFDVEEDEVNFDDRRFHFIQDKVLQWIPQDKELVLSNGKDTVKYDRLCIACGAHPSTPFPNDKILTIRDTESAEQLQRHLKGAKNIAVVGNGGIATEVVFELKGVNITWVIRDEYASSVFFNPTIAEFFRDRLEKGSKNAGVLRRLRYAIDAPDVAGRDENIPGCALGPDWISTLSIDSDSKERCVRIIPNAEVEAVQDVENGLRLSLSNSESIDCELVIWATGVVPSTSLWKQNCEELRLSSDGGIVVDDAMRTSVRDVYACGDVCTPEWSSPSVYWKQMRLWTQARQMGDFCARSMMANGEIETDFCFELFTHTTTFFGYKVVFLGDFKAERQPEGWYTIERVIENDHFVQCVMYNHRVVGAILVGETNLEETMENLILNKTDLERIEENFLDPQIDIEDYFD